MREGQWVKILVRRFDSPDTEFIGKVVGITDTAVVAESRGTRWAMDLENDQPAVWISPMTKADWAARNRRKHAGFRL